MVEIVRRGRGIRDKRGSGATHRKRSEPAFARELELAKQAALAAGNLLDRHYRNRAFDVGSKGRDNPVTTADLEADSAIKEILRNGFPKYGWLSEETADNTERLSAERVWIVDPLDGTKEFINRIPEFCVSIALAERGVPVAGVIYNPIKKELFWAARRQGCHVGKRRVLVSKTRVLGRSVLLASRSEIKRGEWTSYAGQFKLRPIGSVAYKLALLAANKADATFTLTPKSEWDVAAGVALVLEAGGTVTDLKGRIVEFNQPRPKLTGLIASNGILHQSIEQLIERKRRESESPAAGG